ncbi:MAG TPA: hypothetical protein PK530_05115, partial [Anaerolineales bacterium]|nr:hypothetical protein [Anaerolineales bacterium]
MDIVGKRYLYFAISLVAIVPGLIGLLLWGLPLAVDFAGGSLSEIRFESGKTPTLEAVREVYTQFGYADAEVRSSGTDELIVRTPNMDDATNNRIIETLQTQLNDTITILRFESVGPTVGREVTTRAAGAVALAAVAIMFFIWYAFRGVPNAY